MNPGFVYHHGQICNAGILCGTPNQASVRSLLDFTSVTIDSSGCPLFTFAGNPTGTPTTNGSANTFNYVTRQLTGCFATNAAGIATLTTPLLGAGSPGGNGHSSPATGACVAASRLTFRMNPVPHGRVVRVVAFVNGHRVLARHGRNITRISFARPRASRLQVRIVSTNNQGGQVITRRTFTACTRTPVHGRTRRHRRR